MRRRERIHLHHQWALGDTVMFTALIRDIHRAWPGRYEISVQSAFSNLWKGSPHVVPPSPGVRTIRISWAGAMKHNGRAMVDGVRRPRHLLAWYHHDFEQKTGVPVPVTEPRGEIHLLPEEREPLLSGRYWVVMGGGKLDITNKHWPTARYQGVVDALRACGVHCVQAGATHKKHVHPPLTGCLNLVGKTDDARDFVNLIAHADGVVCPNTAAMHVAAVCQRPCVVIAGGREEPWTAAYVDAYGAFGPHCRPVAVPHRFLHTLGLLPCCDVQGCWKRRTVPLEKRDATPAGQKELCKRPAKCEGVDTAECMAEISVDHIVEGVLSYYADGTLPPLR